MLATDGIIRGKSELTHYYTLRRSQGWEEEIPLLESMEMMEQWLFIVVRQFEGTKVAFGACVLCLYLIGSL